jgi:hypothetical protein
MFRQEAALMSSKNLAEEFYNAFTRRDGETMAALYDESASFSDPVFPKLNSAQCQNMWRMLCATGKDLRVEYKILEYNSERFVVYWDAYYSFSATGNFVHNKVTSTIQFKDSKIIAHHDDFDFYAWSRQAFGIIGVLLGWTPYFQRKVQSKASTSLAAFTIKSSSGAPK